MTWSLSSSIQTNIELMRGPASDLASSWNCATLASSVMARPVRCAEDLLDQGSIVPVGQVVGAAYEEAGRLVDLGPDVATLSAARGLGGLKSLGQQEGGTGFVGVS